MSYNLKLKLLETQVSNAVKVFDKAIQNLEKSNQEYVSLKTEIEQEIGTLNKTISDVDEKINKNEKMLVNFKKLFN